MNEKLYYLSQSIYTEPGKFKQYYPTNVTEMEIVFQFIKKIIIHPIEAKKLGLKNDYKEIMRQHVFHRTIIDIFMHEKMHKILPLLSANIDTLPDQRVILSCDHVSLLFCSILRNSNIPGRLRVGFATYIVKGQNIPHWICEYLDRKENKWILIDPDIQRVKVNAKEFYSSGKMWLESRSDNIDSSTIHIGNYHGKNAIKYELLNDINCIFKNELVNYDWMITRSGQKKPKIMSTPYEKLSVAELNLLDSMALLSCSKTINITELQKLYYSYISEFNLRKPSHMESAAHNT